MSEPDNSAVAARKETNAQRVLAFIVTHKRQHDGCAPMVREIMRGMNFRTPSVVAYYLDLLERRGQIRRVQGEYKICRECRLPPRRRILPRCRMIGRGAADGESDPNG
jgi:SOS-response transcriptional repressor LexA